MKTLKGFHASIFRDNYNSTINVLRDANYATIIDESMPELFNADKDHPPVRLVKREIYGKQYLHFEPLTPGNYAFGGAFIWCCDSRFRELSERPIQLHDRNMSLE